MDEWSGLRYPGAVIGSAAALLQMRLVHVVQSNPAGLQHPAKRWTHRLQLPWVGVGPDERRGQYRGAFSELLDRQLGAVFQLTWFRRWRPVHPRFIVDSDDMGWQLGDLCGLSFV